MSNVLEYVLSLKDKYTKSMKNIGVENDRQLEVFAKLQKQSELVSKDFKHLGNNVTTLSQKLSLLKSERDLIDQKDIHIIRRYNAEISATERQINRLQTATRGSALGRWTKQLFNAIPGANLLTNPIVLASAGIYKLNSALTAGATAYQEYSVEANKLNAVMRNTMGASDDQVRSILKLAQAQEKIGVISQSTQMAGAQELSTYLSKKESLEKLLPVMNDMLAQQYGLNATGEQAINIGSMMGKVMDGQVGALSRYGYKFDENQEKLLKFGTEAQRVATLVDVVTESVGGVNKALLDTPEGKLKKAANEAEALKIRVGQLWTRIKATWSDSTSKFAEFQEKIVRFFEQNADKIEAFVKKAGTVFSKFITTISEWLSRLNRVYRDNETAIHAVLVAIGLLGTAYAAYTTYVGLAELAQLRFVKALWKVNWAMLKNPLTWLVVLIAINIAYIYYIINAYEGWGDAWRSLVELLRLGLDDFVLDVKITWEKIKNFFAKGYDFIMKGWYKVQALWNKDAANEGLAKLQADAEERQRKIGSFERQKVVNSIEKVIARRGITLFQTKSVSDVVGDLANKAKGILPANLPGSDNTGTSSIGSDIGKTSEAIATGGTKNTTVNITIGNMIEGFTVNSATLNDSLADIQNKVVEAVTRAVAMGASLGT